MATTAENLGNVMGFSRLFGVDPDLPKKGKRTHTVCYIIQTLELDLHVRYCVWFAITYRVIIY